MFATAYHQLRYAAGLLRGRSVPVASLERLAADLVATIREFGAPGEDSQLIPGQQGGVDAHVRQTMTTRGLRLTAARAARLTGYYRSVFAGDVPNPAEITLDSWARLPVTPKSALRGDPAAFVAAGVTPAVQGLTTGTSGVPTTVWFSDRELRMLFALNVISAVLAQRLRPGHTVAYAASSRATVPLQCVQAGVRGAGAALVHLGIIEPELALERLAAPLGLPGRPRRITHLVANSSYLAALVETGERDGRRSDQFGLLSIGVGGEVLSDALRRRAEALFEAPITAGYALTEALPAGAVACSAGHLHHGGEFGYVEVLDPVSHRPAAPGKLGTLVVTPLVPYRECTLLLRYDTGDLVRTLAQPATCELAAVPATSDVLGRYSGPLSARVPQREVLEVLDAERGCPQPARYALTEDPAGPLLHVLVRRRSPNLLSRLEEAAARRGLDLHGIVAHDDPARLPAAPPPRSDLREYSFETAAAQRAAASAGAPVGSRT